MQNYLLGIMADKIAIHVRCVHIQRYTQFQIHVVNGAAEKNFLQTTDSEY